MAKQGLSNGVKREEEVPERAPERRSEIPMQRMMDECRQSVARIEVEYVRLLKDRVSGGEFRGLRKDMERAMETLHGYEKTLKKHPETLCIRQEMEECLAALKKLFSDARRYVRVDRVTEFKDSIGEEIRRIEEWVRGTFYLPLQLPSTDLKGNSHAADLNGSPDNTITADGTEEEVGVLEPEAEFVPPPPEVPVRGIPEAAPDILSPSDQQTVVTALKREASFGYDRFISSLPTACPEWPEEMTEEMILRIMSLSKTLLFALQEAVQEEPRSLEELVGSLRQALEFNDVQEKIGLLPKAAQEQLDILVLQPLRAGILDIQSQDDVLELIDRAGTGEVLPQRKEEVQFFLLGISPGEGDGRPFTEREKQKIFTWTQHWWDKDVENADKVQELLGRLCRQVRGGVPYRGDAAPLRAHITELIRLRRKKTTEAAKNGVPLSAVPALPEATRPAAPEVHKPQETGPEQMAACWDKLFADVTRSLPKLTAFFAVSAETVKERHDHLDDFIDSFAVDLQTKIFPPAMLVTVQDVKFAVWARIEQWVLESHESTGMAAVGSDPEDQADWLLDLIRRKAYFDNDPWKPGELRHLLILMVKGRKEAPLIGGFARERVQNMLRMQAAVAVSSEKLAKPAQHQTTPDELPEPADEVIAESPTDVPVVPDTPAPVANAVQPADAPVVVTDSFARAEAVMMPNAVQPQKEKEEDSPERKKTKAWVAMVYADFASLYAAVGPVVRGVLQDPKSFRDAANSMAKGRYPDDGHRVPLEVLADIAAEKQMAIDAFRYLPQLKKGEQRSAIGDDAARICEHVYGGAGGDRLHTLKQLFVDLCSQRDRGIFNSKMFAGSYEMLRLESLGFTAETDLAVAPEPEPESPDPVRLEEEALVLAATSLDAFPPDGELDKFERAALCDRIIQEVYGGAADRALAHRLIVKAEQARWPGRMIRREPEQPAPAPVSAPTTLDYTTSKWKEIFRQLETKEMMSAIFGEEVPKEPAERETGMLSVEQTLWGKVLLKDPTFRSNELQPVVLLSAEFHVAKLHARTYSSEVAFAERIRSEVYVGRGKDGEVVLRKIKDYGSLLKALREVRLRLQKGRTMTLEEYVSIRMGDASPIAIAERQFEARKEQERLACEKADLALLPPLKSAALTPDALADQEKDALKKMMDAKVRDHVDLDDMKTQTDMITLMRATINTRRIRVRAPQVLEDAVAQYFADYLDARPVKKTPASSEPTPVESQIPAPPEPTSDENKSATPEESLVADPVDPISEPSVTTSPDKVTSVAESSQTVPTQVVQEVASEAEGRERRIEIARVALVDRMRPMIQQHARALHPDMKSVQEIERDLAALLERATGMEIRLEEFNDHPSLNYLSDQKGSIDKFERLDDPASLRELLKTIGEHEVRTTVLENLLAAARALQGDVDQLMDQCAAVRERHVPMWTGFYAAMHYRKNKLPVQLALKDANDILPVLNELFEGEPDVLQIVDEHWLLQELIEQNNDAYEGALMEKVIGRIQKMNKLSKCIQDIEHIFSHFPKEAAPALAPTPLPVAPAPVTHPSPALPSSAQENSVPKPASAATQGKTPAKTLDQLKVGPVATIKFGRVEYPLNELQVRLLQLLIILPTNVVVQSTGTLKQRSEFYQNIWFGRKYDDLLKLWETVYGKPVPTRTDMQQALEPISGTKGGDAETSSKRVTIPERDKTPKPVIFFNPGSLTSILPTTPTYKFIRSLKGEFALDDALEQKILGAIDSLDKQEADRVRKKLIQKGKISV